MNDAAVCRPPAPCSCLHHDEEDGPAGEEPDWVKRERDSFNEVRDTNNDGFMDNQEVEKLVITTCIIT